MPSISIVTTVFNGERTIAATIDSVLAQAVELEYIIIDGASTDSTMDVVRSYGNRISVVESAPDNGIYDGMNRGIDLATGDWIGILNSDDSYLPGVLARVLEASSANVDVIHGDMILLKDDLGLAIRCRKEAGRSYFRQQPAFHPTMFVRKSVYVEIGKYDQDLTLAADWDFMINALEADKKFLRLDDALTVMKMGGMSEKAHFRVPFEIVRLYLRYGGGVKDYCWWLRYYLTRIGQWTLSARKMGPAAIERKLRRSGFTDYNSLVPNKTPI